MPTADPTSLSSARQRIADQLTDAWQDSIAVATKRGTRYISIADLRLLLSGDGRAIRVIETPEQHKAALVEVERLMDANPEAGTEDCERLKLLSVVVECYERREFPIDPDGYVLASAVPPDCVVLERSIWLDCLNLVELFAGHDAEETVKAFIKRARAVALSPVVQIASGAGEEGLSGDGETAQTITEAPERSCLVCGHLRKLAVWHGTTGEGVCVRCRDARHVISGGEIIPAFSIHAEEPDKAKLLAVVDRVMQHYLGEGAPAYGDARWLADYALHIHYRIENMERSQRERSGAGEEGSERARPQIVPDRGITALALRYLYLAPAAALTEFIGRDDEVNELRTRAEQEWNHNYAAKKSQTPDGST